MTVVILACGTGDRVAIRVPSGTAELYLAVRARPAFPSTRTTRTSGPNWSGAKRTSAR
jgi:hypothetical protein